MCRVGVARRGAPVWVRLPALSLLLLLSLALTACATAGKAPQGAKVIEGVPFYPQEDYECGPSALATVLSYHRLKGGGPAVTPDEVAEKIYSPTARGALGLDLARCAEGMGFSAEEKRGSVGALRALVDEGTPPIILVDYGISFYQVNHFMAVTGYTDDGIIVNSGNRQGVVIENDALARIWKKTGYWTLVVRPRR